MQFNKIIMKKNKFVSLAVLSSLAVLVLSSMMLPASKIKLRLKPKAGQVFNHEIITDMDMSVMGQVMKMHSVFYMENHVNTIADGKINSDFVITRILNTSTMPGFGEMSYDSDKKEPAADPMSQQMAQSFGVLVNKKVGATMDQMGNLEGSLDLSSFGDNSTADQIRTLQQNINSITFGFPEKELAVGDSWTVDQDTKSQIPMEITTTYTLKEINKDTIVLQVNGEVSSAEGASSARGTSTGHFVLDRKTCWTVSGETNMDINITVDANGMQQNMDMTMKMTVK